MLRPTMRAAWNMVSAAKRLGGAPRRLVVCVPSVRRLTTACVTARLPEESSTKTRFARLLPGMELAEGGDIVDAGIGARIDRQHQAFLEHDPDAIGHRQPFRIAFTVP